MSHSEISVNYFRCNNLYWPADIVFAALYMRDMIGGGET